MHPSRIFLAVLLCAPLPALAQALAPPVGDTMRDSVAKWVETMREIQKEEDKWEHDSEVLGDYRDALQSEIADLENAIAEAKTRKLGSDKDSVGLTEQRDQFAEAKNELAVAVRNLENSALESAQSFPRCLTSDSKMAQVLEEIRTDVGMLGNQADKQLPKRLNNILLLLAEAEKFQQSVHLRDELHSGPDGREFNMKMVYFGLGVAFGVNEDGDFAIVGQPGADGWTYAEHDDLAPQIRRLIEVTTGDVEAGFVSLPIKLK